jgi:hypothetical protein
MELTDEEKLDFVDEMQNPGMIVYAEEETTAAPTITTDENTLVPDFVEDQ